MGVESLMKGVTGGKGCSDESLFAVWTISHMKCYELIWWCSVRCAEFCLVDVLCFPDF